MIPDVAALIRAAVIDRGFPRISARQADNFTG
jgi:hypothetical protein